MTGRVRETTARMAAPTTRTSGAAATPVATTATAATTSAAIATTPICYRPSNGIRVCHKVAFTPVIL